MSRREKQIVLALSIVIALTRLMALSRSMWDWDEGLFSIALHDFNVAAHHPHPPGFPLYVAAGRVMRVVIHDDFRALRAIELIASMFLFPAMFALARAMKFPFATAVSAGVLLAFFPNVWFYGGTAFSDIFNLVLLMTALALLFGDRYLLGTVVFALSLLVRPQNILCAKKVKTGESPAGTAPSRRRSGGGGTPPCRPPGRRRDTLPSPSSSSRLATASRRRRPDGAPTSTPCAGTSTTLPRSTASRTRTASRRCTSSRSSSSIRSRRGTG